MKYDIKPLITRRSTSVRNLTEPAPSKDDLKTILKIGARVPDHGKLTPFYFITFEGSARHEISPLLKDILSYFFLYKVLNTLSQLV